MGHVKHLHEVEGDNLIELILQKMKEDSASQLGDHDPPFCVQHHTTHWSFYISLFKFKSFDQLVPPKLLQILDIYSGVALWFAWKHRGIGKSFEILRNIA